jgi:hypothetical protein
MMAFDLFFLYVPQSRLGNISGEIKPLSVIKATGRDCCERNQKDIRIDRDVEKL